MTGLLPGLGINADRLYHGQPSTTGTAVYTCPGTAGSAARTSVSSVKIANPSPAAMLVRLGLIPQGGTSDGTHYLLGDVLIPANDTYSDDVSFILRAGDALEATSSTLPPPVGVASATVTTGGTLSAATYYYKVTATNANGETIGSGETSITTTGSTSVNTVSWTRSLGATGYKVYRSTTSGSEILLGTVSSGSTVTYSDTGSVTPAGASVPSTGTAGGCIFTISGTELPA